MLIKLLMNTFLRAIKCHMCGADTLNTMKLTQNGSHFADDFLIFIFLVLFKFKFHTFFPIVNISISQHWFR